MALTLTSDERAELERRIRSLTIRAEDARRARVILMLTDGASYSMIEATVPCYRDYINRWRRRFLAKRLEGLRPQYRGQPPTVLTPTMEARILNKTRQSPPDGSTHWSTRKLGRLLKIHHNLVGKAWRRAGLQPHRFERYMQSDDPDFETKAADVIGLDVNPPDHAAASPSTKRRPFKRSTVSIRSCRCRRAALNAMASSITGTACCRCSPRSTPKSGEVLAYAGRAASLPRWRISRGGFDATSVSTTKRRNRSAGAIALRRIELVVLQRVQST
jgi:transposase